MKAAPETAAPRKPEPVQLSVSRGPVPGGLPAEAAAWVAAEVAQQQEHYQRIAAELAAREAERERECLAFFARITGPRGYSVHAGNRRTLAPEELPARPDRPWRVLW
jgi:hypothetical protein